MKLINGGVCAAQGFKASGVHCGFRHNKLKNDLALVFSEKLASAAAVYTTNAVKGAPLTVTKNHILLSLNTKKAPQRVPKKQMKPVKV